nr:hypothetical protein [Tanacetum cinerariifolium]
MQKEFGMPVFRMTVWLMRLSLTKDQKEEIGSHSINISDNSLDTSSHMDINDVVKVVDSVENNSIDDLNDLYTKFNELDQDFNDDKDPMINLTDTLLKQPEVLKEEDVNKDQVSNHVVETSDPSRPPSFEHINRSFSYTSKCSTSFSIHHKKDIKGISIIHELNRIIKVGTSLGYDVRRCRKSHNRMINGIGNWKSLVRNCFMINIYAPQESSAKFSLWKIDDFMQHQDGKFILFGDMNIVRHEHEMFGSIFSNYEANQFNSFIDFSGLIDLPIGDILDALPDIRITALDCLWSDQTPILLHVSKLVFGPSPFKIYNSWLLRDDFHEDIKSACSSLETNSNGCSIPHIDRDNRIKLLQVIDNLDNLEARDLIQKAHIKWDIEGDENSKFFHGMINHKRSQTSLALCTMQLDFKPEPY